jgi:hypothetical protein
MTSIEPLAIARTVDGTAKTVTIEDVDAKLVWRASLPGASTYDRAAHTLRALQGQGASAIDLLPLALPASWMVNAKATSHAMQEWLGPSFVDVWSVVLEGVGFVLSPGEWLALPSEERDAIAAAVTALAHGRNGATLAAVSKVLALLRPQLVPLMDDAAIWFATGEVSEPTTADAPSAPPTLFLPMMDWFARQVIASEKALVAAAVRHDRAVLDAAQVLDRVLWIESWGHRLRSREQPRSIALT